MDLEEKKKQISERLEQLKEEPEADSKTSGRYKESYELFLKAWKNDRSQGPSSPLPENPKHLKCTITDTETGAKAEGWGETKSQARIDAINKLKG